MKSNLARISIVLLGFIIACVLGVFGAFAYEGGNSLKLIIPGEIFFITLIPLGVCIMAFGVMKTDAAILRALSMIFSHKPEPLTPAQCNIIRTWGYITYVAGFISTILGTVITLCYLSSGVEVIAEHAAATICAVFFALLVNGIFIQPVLRRSEWLAVGGDKEENPKFSGYFFGGLIVLLALLIITGFSIAYFYQRNEKVSEAPRPEEVPDFILSEMKTIVGNTKGKQQLLFSMFFDAPPAARKKLELHRAQVIDAINHLGNEVQPEDLKDMNKLRTSLSEGAKAVANIILAEGVPQNEIPDSATVRNVYLLDLFPVSILEDRGPRTLTNDQSQKFKDDKEFILNEMVTSVVGPENERYLLTTVFFELSPDNFQKLEDKRGQVIHYTEGILEKVKEQDLDDPSKLQKSLASEILKSANEISPDAHVTHIYILEFSTTTHPLHLTGPNS